MTGNTPRTQHSARVPAEVAPTANSDRPGSIRRIVNLVTGAMQLKSARRLFSLRLFLAILTAAILIVGIHYWAPNAILSRFVAVAVLLAGIAIQIWAIDRATVCFGSQEPESGWRYSGGNVWVAQRNLKQSICFLLEALLLWGAVCSLGLNMMEVLFGNLR
jgi:hypothetical protein